MDSKERQVALQNELLELIGRGTTARLDDAEFDQIARRVFAYQYELNPAYRAYCDLRGVSPDRLSLWSEVPAVPTDAFKAVPLVSGDPRDVTTVFRTSGTTAGREQRGEHHIIDLSLYDAALREGFRTHLLHDQAQMQILVLLQPAEEMPDSSLAHMLSAAVDEFGAPGSGHFVGSEGLQIKPLIHHFRDAEDSGEPLLLAGTSFSFVHLIDALAERGEAWSLPSGSRVMDTGGFKGKSRELSRDELYAGIEKSLGISARWCINEYGMTELSSQFYDGIAGDPAADVLTERQHVGPPWIRTVAADLETLEHLPNGERGVLRHYDLANLHSVMALQTADLGVVTEDGIRVFGRARGAEARGCSIATDELLSVT